MTSLTCIVDKEKDGSELLYIQTTINKISLYSRDTVLLYSSKSIATVLNLKVFLKFSSFMYLTEPHSGFLVEIVWVFERHNLHGRTVHIHVLFRLDLQRKNRGYYLCRQMLYFILRYILYIITTFKRENVQKFKIRIISKNSSTHAYS